MPSIRVKGSVYSSLGDGPNEEPRTLASIFTPGSPTLQARAPRARPSLPVLRHDESQQSPTSPYQAQTLPRRPRANTAASRVQAHCMQSTIRNSRALPMLEQGTQMASPASIQPTSPSIPSARHEDGMIMMEGVQADVMVPSHAGQQPGHIESNLSLSLSQNDPQHPGMSLEPDEHHHDDIVEHLDVIDPRIGAVTNLTNAANAILIPPSSWYSRKPVVILTSPPRSSVPTDGGETGSEQFEDDLDRHVDDVLKRPSKWRRTFQGVWTFLKTPMGIIVGIYGFLVVFWGAAIVIFLIKIINFHNANTQGFWVEVSSQIENGLFTVTGIGLIPSRVLDTYRIYKIWHYKRKTIALRKIAGLPQLFDVDDLPDPIYDPNYVHVLTQEQQDDLHRQQMKFQHHQTWYRPHGTETHRAFPINMALAICFLNDGNSIFQIILCGTMWGLNRFERPPWSTGTLIPASFLCGISAAVLIWRGGERTKRVEEVRERLQAALKMAVNVQQAAPSMDYSSSAAPSIARSEQVRESDLKVLPRGASVVSLDDAATVDEHMVITPMDEKQAP